MTPSTPTDRQPPPAWAVRTKADRAVLVAGYYWDQDAADRVIRFAETHYAPKYVEGDFRLFGWQKRTLMAVYGWRRPDGGRRFTKALLHVAKKNGKSLLTSVIAAYELFGGVCRSPLVVSASTTRQNAAQIFDHLKHAVGKSQALQAVCKVIPSEKRLRAESRDGDYWSMSSDAPGAEGWNISCGIVDECHAHKSPKLFNTLEYGTVGRADGFLFIISTAGEDLDHFYYGLVCKARRIIGGEDLDPAFYAEVYEVDPDKEDLDAPATYSKANPSLDADGYAGFTSEKFGEQLREARAAGGTRWRNFLRYRLNVFIAAEENVWIALDLWDRCKGRIDLAAVKAAPCFLGLDGSLTTDPTSVSACWHLPGSKYVAQSWAWVAEEGVKRREKSNLPKYQQYAAAGAMTITPGATMSKAAVLKHLLWLKEAYNVRGLVADINLLWTFGDELRDEHGIQAAEMDQSAKNYGPLCDELLARVTAGDLIHDGNPWLRYSVGSVRLKVDEHNRAKPVKARSPDHIDGAVSLLMAFGQAHAFGVTAPPEEIIEYAFLV